MSGQRQKNRPEQGVLAFPAESRSDAPKAAAPGTETQVAKRKSESLAGTERLMAEVCALENCKQALQRVKANKGSPGVDGMTVDELLEYLEAVEARTDKVPRASQTGRRKGPGGANRRESSRSLAARELARSDHCLAQCLLCRARASAYGRTVLA